MSTIAPVRPAVIAFALLIATGGFADPVPAQFDFEEAELSGAWSANANEGTLRITRDPENVREGRGALEFSWEATEGRLAIVKVEPIAFDERPRSLRLSVKLSEGGPVMYGVREAGGAEYQGYLHSPGGVWHDVAVSLNELMLSETCEGEDARLNVREIVGITVADLSNISGEAGKSLGIKQGRQQMWLDNVELSTRLAPSRSSRGPADELIIDDFARPRALDDAVIRALAIGGPRLSLTDGPGGDNPSALRVEYHRDGYPWAGFVAAVGHLDLTERSRICLNVRADNAAPLQVVLEERDGSKYVARHRLDPSKGWYTIKLPFEKFELDRQTTDENDRLDLDQLRVIIPVVGVKRAETEGVGAWEVSRIWVE